MSEPKIKKGDICLLLRGNPYRGVETGPGYGRKVKVKVLRMHRKGQVTCELMQDDPASSCGPFKKGETDVWHVDSLALVTSEKVVTRVKRYSTKQLDRWNKDNKEKPLVFARLKSQEQMKQLESLVKFLGVTKAEFIVSLIECALCRFV